MDKKVIKTLEIARALKPQKVTGRNFHVTCIFDKSRLISIGYNDYTKVHPHKQIGFKYRNYKDNNAKYEPCRHSEVDALIGLGEKDCRRYQFVNVRIDNNNEAANAHPCPNCLSLLQMVKFKSILYTKTKDEVVEIKYN